jgi:hypothetical protein
MRKQFRYWWSACALLAALPLTLQGIDIRVVSGRPDMVTGGDALVEIDGIGQSVTHDLSVSLNGRDITAEFRAGQRTGTLLGLVERLTPGKNRLAVFRGRSVIAHAELINHPITGPVFSGPHQKPFACEPQSVKMGPPLDSDCSLPTQVNYYYRSTSGPFATCPVAPPTNRTNFRPYDPAAPRPDDMAQTTTLDGHTVDFVVRREVGTINRAIYSIAFLHQPGSPLPTPWTSIPSWNGRLVYSFQGGCEPGYNQGLTAPPLTEAVLAQGFAEAGSTLNTFGNNSDDVLSAETMMMVKEYFIKHFGVPVHTLGNGGSGGSMQQYLIAQNYPGLLDGLSTDISFPDTFSVIPDAADCALLKHAFDSSASSWSVEQKGALSGFSNWNVCETWFTSHYAPGWIQPKRCVAVPPAEVYDPVKNPHGVRCDLYSNQVNIWGRDPATGFARRALDNTGVQYGLAAFQTGKISAEQFLELNERIGGFDMDANFVARRMEADAEALRVAYKTGRIERGGGSLGSIPILDGRGYRDVIGNFHDKLRTHQVQARIAAANGSASNLAIFVQPPRTWTPLLVLNEWLDKVARDTSNDRAAVKVARNRPADALDACWIQGQRINEPATYSGPGKCNEAYPAHGNPRMAGGALLSGTILKCALKPVDASDYAGKLTEDQMMRLKTIFPAGVCDYGKPGIGEDTRNEVWRVY